MVSDTRAVSSVFGVAILLGMVVAGSVVVVAVGGAALEETRGGLDTGRAEKAMTQFDSRSAMVALGGTSHQGIDLPADRNGRYGVDTGTGWMNVTRYNMSADDHTSLVNVTLGALVYENDDGTIAYQGGGVWQDSGAGARMLSPPEFHFRESTLTLPIITVDGDASIGGSASVTRADASRVYYPNRSADSSFTNPLDQGHVNVTVNSEYYRAWGRFFEQRTDGNVSYDHDRGTVRVKLVVPFDEGFDNSLAQVESGEIRFNGNKRHDDAVTGVNYPLIDERIEDRIGTCESDATACKDIPGNDTIVSGGTYYTNDPVHELHVEDPGGNVTVVANTNFNPSEVTVQSAHNTTILVRRGVSFGSINDDGPVDRFSLGVHSSGAVNANGGFEFDGLLYAPGSDCSFNGGSNAVEPNVVGGVVCEDITANGNPNDFLYDDDILNASLDLSGEEIPITYLHVTTNPINVTSG